MEGIVLAQLAIFAEEWHYLLPAERLDKFVSEQHIVLAEVAVTRGACRLTVFTKGKATNKRPGFVKLGSVCQFLFQTSDLVTIPIVLLANDFMVRLKFVEVLLELTYFILQTANRLISSPVLYRNEFLFLGVGMNIAIRLNQGVNLIFAYCNSLFKF